MKLTRRKLAAAVLGSSAAALAQTQPATATPDDELKAARDRMRANADALGAVKLAMPVEPAFQFKT